MKIREFTIPDTAYAIRTHRILNEYDVREYESVTFPNDPKGGVALYLKRLASFGLLLDDGPFFLDVLDENDDILDTYHTDRDGFEYLRGKLKFRVVR